MVGPFGLRPNKTMESRALGMARPLVHEQGHTVRLFMPPWQTPEDAERLWEIDGVEVRYVSLRGGIIGTTRRLIKEVTAWQPDIVHCFKPKAYSGLVGWWLWQMRKQNLPLVFDTDDWEGWGGWNDLAPYSPLQKHFFAWQEKWGLQHCHMVTTASRTLQSLAWSLGIPQDRVAYLPNGAGIPLNGELLSTDDEGVHSLQRILAGRPTLLLYSRLFEFDTGRLVRILRGVKTAVPDLAILTIGASLYAQDAQTFAAQLGELQEAVVDVGWVELAKLPFVLSCADVGIYLMEDTLLNRTKCPVKLADMIAVGLPVVGEAVGQVREYVAHQKTGLLYTSGDIAGITAGIIQLLHDAPLRVQFGQSAKKRYEEQFQWSIVAHHLEDCYAKARLY